MKRPAFVALLLQSLLIAFGLSAEPSGFMERLHLWDRELNWTNRSDPTAPQRIMLEIPTYMSNLEPRIDSGDEDAAAAWVAARQLGMRLSGVPPGDKNRLLSAIELIRAKADRGDPSFKYLLWRNRDIAHLSPDEADLILKEAALGGNISALSHIVSGTDFLSGRINLENNLEYYKFSIIYAGVFCKVMPNNERSATTGFAKLLQAAQRARMEQREEADGKELPYKDPVSRMEEEALMCLKKMNWEELDRNRIFTVDTAQVVKAPREVEK